MKIRRRTPGMVRSAWAALTFLILLGGVLHVSLWAAMFDTKSADIRHPYFPWPLDARQEYRGTGSATGIKLVHSASGVEVVDGVRCLKVAKKITGEPDSYFWIAQSEDGAIWQLRKYDGLKRRYSETDSLFLMKDPVIGSRCGLGFDDSNELEVIATDAVAESPLGRFVGCVVLEHDWGGKSRHYLAPKAGIVRYEDFNSAGFQTAALELVSTTLAKPDTQPPSVVITSGPRSNTRVTNEVIVLQGKASDNMAVIALEYCLSNATTTSRWQPVQGTDTWSVTVSNLVYGANTIRVRAQDLAGNLSPQISRAYVRLCPVGIATNGCGKVSRPAFPRPGYAEVGRTYAIIASSCAGWLFSNWVASVGGIAEVAGTTTRLSFVMQPEMTLQANFVPNPFAPRKGRYAGLFSNPNQHAHQSAGFFSGTLTDRGAFTARLQLAGKTCSLAGQFAIDGSLSKVVTCSGSSPLSVSLHLDPGGGAVMTGNVSDGTWLADLTAYGTNSAKAALQPGQFTVIIPGSEEAWREPGGDGFGTVILDKYGNVRLTGTLGDGTKVTRTTIVAREGYWPFYLPLYSGSGSMHGWLTFTNEPGSDLRGRLNWVKSAQPGKLYAAGFTNQAEAIGSRYRQAPADGRILNFTNGILVLENGTLPQTITNYFLLGPGNKITNLSNSKLTLSLTPTSGSFTGTLRSPPTAAPISFSGAVLQKQNLGSGIFLGTNQTGRVWIGPRQD